MKAAKFHAAGQPLTIVDRRVPEPGPGQILIAVRRCGICGSDLTMTDPESPVAFGPGCVPGHEFVGEVVALGAGGDSCRAGHKAIAFPLGACGTCAACIARVPYACTVCTYLMGRIRPIPGRSGQSSVCACPRPCRSLMARWLNHSSAGHRPPDSAGLAQHARACAWSRADPSGGDLLGGARM